MSTLTDRDINLQPTSNPTNTEKAPVAGEENQPQEAQQHKQVLEQKTLENNEYVLACQWQ